MKSLINDRVWICMFVELIVLFSNSFFVLDRNNYNECFKGMYNINFKGKFSLKKVMNC